MDKKKNGIPKLRFPGFTGAWEQRKLGDFFKKYQNKIFLDDATKYIQISVRNTGKVEYRTTNYGKNIGRKRQYLVDTKNYPDTLIFTRQTIYEGGIGYIPSSLNGAIVTENMPLLAKNSKIDKNFSKILFKTHLYYHNVIEKNKPIGSAQKALHEKVWLESVVTVPTLLEQQKIGEFFKQLDSLITLHQRKLDHLKEQKTGLLQKMFPKKEEVVPEVRFPGFTDAWEQRKLGEVASYRNGKAHEKDISESGKYIVINSKFVSSNGTVRKYSNKMIAPLNKGEISFVLSDVPNGKALARTFLTDQDDTYTLNQRIAGILPKQGVNSYFMSTLMNRNSYFLKFNDGVGQTNLSKRDVTEWKAFYPSHAEQKKIGGFLQQFDSLIALHQRKLDHLQLLKKGLLQQMFV